jgi:hypothetical protein
MKYIGEVASKSGKVYRVEPLWSGYCLKDETGRTRQVSDLKNYTVLRVYGLEYRPEVIK